MSEVQVDIRSKTEMEVVVEEKKFTLLFPVGTHVDIAVEACALLHSGLLKVKEQHKEKQEDDDSNKENS